MSKTIKITYHGNSVTVALVERPLLANESEYSNSVLSPKARKFQLTAARRRLVPPLKPLTGKACIALFR